MWVYGIQFITQSKILQMVWGYVQLATLNLKTLGVVDFIDFYSYVGYITDLNVLICKQRCVHWELFSFLSLTVQSWTLTSPVSQLNGENLRKRCEIEKLS